MSKKINIDIHKQYEEIDKLIEKKCDTVEKLKMEIESLRDKLHDLLNEMIDNANAEHISLNKIYSPVCPKCGTLLIENHTQLIKDYCPKCKDGLVYVIDKTGKGKQCFLNDLNR